MSRLDVAAIQADFPILKREVNGNRLVYLDSAASAQKPRQVLDAMTLFQESSYANVHRGVYQVAVEADAAFEGARNDVARFINAPSEREIVFTKNVTESINLVAATWGRANLSAGDVVLLTEMEHHANIVPWQMLAQEKGFELRYLPVADDFTLDLSNLTEMLRDVKLVAVTACSNVLGTLTPIKTITAAAHAAGALVLVDAAQWTPHLPTDVQAWDADFVGITGHKMVGPSGIGVLWAREELLEAMPPFLGGGAMIRDVRLDGFTTNEIPWKFEAGTPPITEAIGLTAAIRYLEGIGMANIRAHELALTSYALHTLTERFGNDIIVHGPADPTLRGGVLSMAFKDIHPHDLSQILDENGVCVRAGHHCAKPLMRRLGVGATARASLYLYNDEADVDALADALAATSSFFG